MNSKQRARNILLTVAALTVAILAMAGCSAEPIDESKVSLPERPVADTATASDATDSAYRARVAEMQATAPEGLDMCSVRQHVSSALDTLERWPQPLLGHDDSCVLTTLDSLAARYVESGDERFLVTLDTLAVYSDGYVGDMMGAVADRIFTSRASDFIGYLHSRAATVSPLQWALTNEWQQTINGGGDTVAQKAERVAMIQTIVDSDSQSPDAQAHLDGMLRSAGLSP